MPEITGSAVLDEGDGGDLIGRTVLFKGILLDEIDGEERRTSFYVLIGKGPDRLTFTYAKQP